MTRARELEIEELEAGRGGGAVVVGREYSDLGEAGDTDAAALMNDDDISLWDNDEGAFGDQETGETGYRDELPEEDDDVFASGDADDDPKVKKGAGNR